MNIAIVLAGGIGARVGSPLPKQFIKVLGKPIMIYTLETFQACEQIDEIVLVCLENSIELAKKYCKRYNISKLKTIVAGGKEFIDSCINGMDVVKAQNEDVVIISSADRPLTTLEEIEDSINVCKQNGCGIAARKCSLCMFKVGEDRGCSSEYLRNDLVQTSTPWAFNYYKLKSALEKYRNNMLPNCESYPVAIFVADGNSAYFSKADANNFKITEKYDVKLFKEVLNERRRNKK